MAYAALIDKSLVKAFNLLKDLAVPVVFVKKTAGNFDFSSGTVSGSTEENINVKVVFISMKKSSNEKNVEEKEVLLKSKGLGDITTFDRILEGTTVWKIGPAVKADGYTVLLRVYREV